MKADMNSETFQACLNAADTLNEFVSRMSLLSALSANSALRRSMESGLVSVNAGGRALSNQMAKPFAVESMETMVEMAKEANQRVLVGWTNQVQNAILMQDEAAIWARSLGERFEAIGHAAMMDVSR